MTACSQFLSTFWLGAKLFGYLSGDPRHLPGQRIGSFGHSTPGPASFLAAVVWLYRTINGDGAVGLSSIVERLLGPLSRIEACE